MRTFRNVLLSLLALFTVALIAILVLFGHKDISVDELKEKYAKAPSVFMDINGMEVHYRDEGDKTDSLPIVLIHGTASSLHTFDDWTNTLKKKHRVIRMDIPAFGLTGPFLDRDYSIANYVRFIDDFLKANGIDKCILGGNSLGGEIAWNYTVSHPKKVDKLILIDAAGYPLQSKEVPIAFIAARIPVVNKLLSFITPRFIVRESLEAVYYDKDKVTEGLVDRYFDLTLRAGNRQALVDRMTAWKISDDTILIKNIEQPTLILWGDQDLLIPVSHAEQFHRDLPNSTVAILENMGHVPMEENPQESLVPVLDFIEY